MEENVPIPIPGAGRFSVIVDPTGAEVALWENAQR
jgi:predicted enzyme related to lactoylglutathione lyase